MGDVVNLNDYRKRLARKSASAAAAGNRARQGRTRADRRRDASESSKAEVQLDAHRLEQKVTESNPGAEKRTHALPDPRGDEPKDAG